MKHPPYIDRLGFKFILGTQYLPYGIIFSWINKIDFIVSGLGNMPPLSVYL